MCTYDETFSMFVFIPASASGIANIVAAILRAQAAICNRPHDSRSLSIKVTAYVTGIVPIVVIIMRFTSRLLGGNKLWWDDWLHLASVVSTQSTRPSAHTYDCKILVIPMTVLLLFNVEAGIGRHVWDLTYPDVVAIQKWSMSLYSFASYHRT
jgi:hypothetical protein